MGRLRLDPLRRAATSPESAFVAGAVGCAAASPARLWPLGLAVACLPFAWRRGRRGATLLLALAVALQGAGWAAARLALDDGAREGRLVEERLGRLRERWSATLDELRSAAQAAARQAGPSVAAPRSSAERARIFAQLESLRAGRALELAVQTPALEPLAWAGRPADLSAYRDVLGAREELVVLEGALTTALVALVPVAGPEGQPVAVVTAERVLASRRDLRNRFVHEFDRLTDGLPGVQVQYYDVRDDPRTAHAFDPPPAQRAWQETRLAAPDGRVLAAARAVALPASPDAALPAPLRRGVSLLLAAAWIGWGYLRRGPLGAHALVATLALRLVFLWLGPPVPAPADALVSPDAYASPLLGPLLRSPLDLLLTVAALAHLAAALLARAARSGVPRASLARLLACGLVAPFALAVPFAWIAETTANSRVDLGPASAAHLVVQTALLLVVVLGGALLFTLFALGGPPPSGRGARLALAVGWLGIALASYELWPRRALGLPLVPALALAALAAALGLTRGRWQIWLGRASTARRALMAPAVAALGALVLYPSLTHFGEKELRREIEADEAPFILRQPRWRDLVLEQTCRRLDELRLLDEAYPTAHPLATEELAFALWSSTELAAFGFSSAIEVQDAQGGLLSRFALNLPSLDEAPAALPESERWVVDRRRLRVGSAERVVLHARRRIVEDGAVRGGLHAYVADDVSTLPFLPARDAYSWLYRPDTREYDRGRDVVLLVYDRAGTLQYASAERPPALSAELRERLRTAPGGFWTTLAIDGRRHHAFLFSDPQGAYALAYPQRRAAGFVAGLVEAGVTLTLLALGLLLALMLARTLLGRRTLALPAAVAGVRGSFRLRLFAAFIAVAVVPAAVLQGVVQRFVSERLRKEAEDQAFERASVAQKAVQDFAFWQRGERGPAAPAVTDAALVWIASLIRNDLDVFADGRLLASSKRELYASGLLASRVAGPVYRELALEGRPRTLSTERLGDFAYRVVSVPVRLDAGRAGILRVPLVLRERELAGVLADLERTVRLAAVVFLLAAAGLAQSMARRISGPLRALTAATRRVAHGDLSARVAPESRDELRVLVDAFNQMAADLERQRRDLERSNRLAAWAEMARQVAHEVKNPLTPIQLSAEHLRRVWRDPQADFGRALDTCTETILNQVHTLRDIVTEFSAFARPAAGEPGELDLAPLLREVAQPYAATLPPHVSLSLETETPAPVRGERRLLARAVVNLIENALQALDGRGHLAVRLSVDAAARRAVVEVEDSGPGIDPDIGARIFEPFFSTKTAGSGLGLALVRKIVEEHGGGVTLESRPGRTCARLWLPLASTRDAPGQAEAQAPTAARAPTDG